ncbi:MAG: hypothetical protein JW855_06155 [Gammaproteobacteria bacterium]|nr:hypothetical protein [Gammaproteobacteria bacterium]
MPKTKKKIIQVSFHNSAKTKKLNVVLCYSSESIQLDKIIQNRMFCRDIRSILQNNDEISTWVSTYSTLAPDDTLWINIKVKPDGRCSCFSIHRNELIPSEKRERIKEIVSGRIRNLLPRRRSEKTNYLASNGSLCSNRDGVPIVPESGKSFSNLYAQRIKGPGSDLSGAKHSFSFWSEEPPFLEEWREAVMSLRRRT